jgi:hypothetical protein
MRAAAALVIIAGITSQAALADIVRHATVPETLRGTWATSAEACQKAGKLVTVLSAKGYVSPDAHCAVDWLAETAGAQGPVYSAHLRCGKNASDAQETTANIVILPKGANRLSIGADFSSLEVYQRCPAE